MKSSTTRQAGYKASLNELGFFRYGDLYLTEKNKIKLDKLAAQEEGATINEREASSSCGITPELSRPVPPMNFNFSQKARRHRVGLERQVIQ